MILSNMADERIVLTPFTNITNFSYPFTFNRDLDQNSGDSILVGGAPGGHGGGANSGVNRRTSGSDWGTCHDWQEAQHTLFQLANLCAAVSLLTPSSFRHHLLFLRCLFLVAFLFFILWAGLFVCMMDVLVWNAIFFVVDLFHIVCLAYNNIPSRFNPELQDLYNKRFKPLKVCRSDFAELCALGNVMPLRKGAKYAMEGLTPCGEKLSMLVKGRLKVTHDGLFLHTIEPNEFVDSPEFDSVPLHAETFEKFQVTIIACEDSLLLSWLYPNLRAFLAANPFLLTVVNYTVGKDVSDKLYKIQELLLREPELHSSNPLPHESSMVNVRKCLVTGDGNDTRRLTHDGAQIGAESVETCV